MTETSYYDKAYDEFVLPGSTSLVDASTQNISNVVPDGYTLRITRITLTNRASNGMASTTGVAIVKFQLITAVTGLNLPNNAQTQPAFEFAVGGTASQEFSENSLKLVVPPGAQLQANLLATGATVDIQVNGRYVKGGY